MELNLTRTLHFRFGGEVVDGELAFKRLEFQREKNRWACVWSLAFVHPEEGRIYGHDALEALTKCIEFVTNLVQHSERDGLIVWWKAEGDHGGLSLEEYPYRPLPKE